MVSCCGSCVEKGCRPGMVQQLGVETSHRTLREVFVLVAYVFGAPLDTAKPLQKNS